MPEVSCDHNLAPVSKSCSRPRPGVKGLVNLGHRPGNLPLTLGLIVRVSRGGSSKRRDLARHDHVLRVGVDRGRRVVGASCGQGEVGRWCKESLLRCGREALLWGRSDRRPGSRTCGKSLAVLDHPSQACQRHAPLRIQVKDNAQDHLQLGRDGQNGSQELGVLSKGPEGRVASAGLLPWVATTCEVHEDDSKAPDVVARSIVAFARERRALALCITC